MSRAISFLVVALSICTIGFAADPADRTDWKSRLIAEAPDEWKALENFLGNCEGSFTETIVSYADEQGPSPRKLFERTIRTQFFLNAEVCGSKYISWKVPDTGDRTVDGSTKDYQY